jgi:peptidoglycan/LPS O-acetylase OafA/YrhL
MTGPGLEKSAVTLSRIPSLDGLRAISIFLVLLGHLVGTRGFLERNRDFDVARLADLGVRVFFVISGYLITTLLLKEWHRSGTISLRDFYIRRAWRIFPAFYAFLIVASLVWALDTYDVLRAATYTSNYHDARPWTLGHLWSLAVEEQFYFLWPAVIALAGPRKALIVAIAVIFVGPLIRLMPWVLSGISFGKGHGFEVYADTLAAGCVLAGSQDWLAANTRYKQWLRSNWLAFGLVVTAVISSAVVAERPRIAAFTVSFANIAIALLIHKVILNPPRWLSYYPLVFAGMLSYSLYLWQQPFLDRANPAFYAAWPLNFLLALACACLSFFVVEKPALAYRDRNRRTTREQVQAAAQS